MFHSSFHPQENLSEFEPVSLAPGLVNGIVWVPSLKLSGHSDISVVRIALITGWLEGRICSWDGTTKLMIAPKVSTTYLPDMQSSPLHLSFCSLPACSGAEPLLLPVVLSPVELKAKGSSPVFLSWKNRADFPLKMAYCSRYHAVRNSCSPALSFPSVGPLSSKRPVLEPSCV